MINKTNNFLKSENKSILDSSNLSSGLNNFGADYILSPRSFDNGVYNKKTSVTQKLPKKVVDYDDEVLTPRSLSSSCNKRFSSSMYTTCSDGEKIVGNAGKYVDKKEDGFLSEVTLKQWSDVDGCIIPVNNTFKVLEPGYYTLEYNNNLGMYFSKQSIELNKLYRLPNSATEIILNDISKFWTLEDTYKKYNRVFKRNYLLYSSPGTGKTSLINLMCQDLIEKYNGIVISLNSSDEIRMYTQAIQRIRKIEPDRKIITVIEDIDNFIGDPYGNGNSSLDTYILNVLDGNLKSGGIVTIATTNYIEKIAGRYKNRPSRFDRVVEFPLPNEESRRIFIEKTVLPEDLSKIDLDKWVSKTKGFTIDHLNELILLFFVFNHSEDESFETVSRMVKENNNLKNKTSENKSALGFLKEI